MYKVVVQKKKTLVEEINNAEKCWRKEKKKTNGEAVQERGKKTSE